MPSGKRTTRKADEDGGCEVVGIAASAGGLAAVSVVLSSLPSDLAAAILIVQHLDPVHPSHLAEILGRRTTLRTRQAGNGDPIDPGIVYFAVPDRHLVVRPNHTISLAATPVVHYSRPAADVLFKSLAEVYRSRAIVVVLSGGGSDGSEGVVAVKEAGGTVIAQNEQTSEFWSMPRSAIETGCVDYVLPLDAIAGCIVDVLGESRRRPSRKRD